MDLWSMWRQEWQHCSPGSLPSSASPSVALARNTSTSVQASPTRSCCLYRHRHPPADQVRLKGVAANRRVEEAVSTHGTVLSFARSVCTALTGCGHRLGQLLNRAFLGGQGSMI